MSRLKPLWLHLTSLSDQLTSSQHLAVACDYDGTLTPIVDHPSRAGLSTRGRQVLERLAAADRVHLAVLSGRTLEDLATHVPIGGVFFAGSAGLETQDGGGQRASSIAPDNSIPQDLRSALEAWIERFPGSWLEDKRFSIALHYRAVEPRLQPAFGAGVRRRVREARERVSLLHGKRVFEIMPAGSRGKPEALERWLENVPAGAAVFYFGDDTNDEPAHETIRSRGGVTVAVGRLASRAEYAVGVPDEVVWFLEWLEREWTSDHAERKARMQQRLERHEDESPAEDTHASEETHPAMANAGGA